MPSIAIVSIAILSMAVVSIAIISGAIVSRAIVSRYSHSKYSHPKYEVCQATDLGLARLSLACPLTLHSLTLGLHLAIGKRSV